MSSYLLPTYKRQPISFVKGQVVTFIPLTERVFGCVNGIAVCGLGHCHPRITAAIADQTRNACTYQQSFGIDWQERAGEKLCQVAGMDKVFLPIAVLRPMKRH